MKCSAWLVLELRNDRFGLNRPHIMAVRQTRPTNQLAVKVTLDVDPDALQPHVEAMVDAGMIHLSLEEADEVVADNVTE